MRFLQKQKPDVGLVGSFGAWKNQGYHVKKGEHGLKIFMPCTRDKKDVNGNKILDKNGKPKIELEKYVAPVPKKSMTMKERIDKAKTKLSEKNHKKLNFMDVKF
mgnify:FL=1